MVRRTDPTPWTEAAIPHVGFQSQRCRSHNSGVGWKAGARTEALFRAKAEKETQEVLSDILVKADVPLQDRTGLEVRRRADRWWPKLLPHSVPHAQPPTGKGALASLPRLLPLKHQRFQRTCQSPDWLRALPQVNYCFNLD